MNRATVVSIRAHLVTVSIAAVVIDAIVLVGMNLFELSESTFETSDFRFAVVLLIVIALASTRLLALAAYRRALRQRRTFACVDGAVHPRYASRFRALALLHLRFCGTNDGGRGLDGHQV
ncbi:hypothetical protein H3V53_17780 [Paraburkholderia bengalensis]|uniref:Uncharacterized protein n=1 Tax=Paraburkholderia bengalensis TaxID=2747562 RepID=A0ABU8ITL4_9BURK